MWICVSNAFDARRITKEVVESASFGRHCETSNWDMLQRSLKEKLMLKKFLLVLDDVWSDDQVQWENLLAPLAEKMQGSKIVVTTRNSSVARIKGMMSPYILDGLSEEDSLSLFTHYAFMGKETKGIHVIEEMRKKIVEKLNGSPLAAKTLGRLCNSKLGKNDWKDFLKTEIWQMQQNDSDIMPILKLTYNHLPAHLKQCFAFCSVFPKEYDFDKEDLVRMWMGQGFIQSGDKKRVEDIGNEYFDHLISMGIFLRKQDKYVMPALMNDLARFVSMDECSRIESSGELSGLSQSPRHLSLIFRCLDKSAQNYLENLTSMRTLIFLDTYETVLDDTLGNLFKSLTSLRVLDLRNKKIKMLPQCISNLKHLRYLNLSNNPLEDLPPSLCELQNLQTLVLLQCESLKNLPEGICKLTNLRHLKIDRSLPSFTRKGRQTKVAGIGSLTLLQELEKFDCTDHRIGELKEMNELRGCLSIRGLENVESETEASKAMLANKRRLEILKLKWSRMDIVSASSELDLRVLEKLQPHPNIRKLTIARYRGINTPCWINKGMPSNLKVIKLHDCPYLKQLPSLGHLFFLEKLEICRMYGVTKVDYEFYGNTKEVKFPSLRKLSFCHMPKWKEWSARKEDQSFPCLIELFMKNCPNLETRPSFPPEVRIIEVCGTRSARS
uniref:Uncharacterized protein n=1 Tax=Ananas comosus var. bracteatus TaxID=296719 RepID=A0A6V7PE20_ANACO|nr:unnamed protein product [Ananas comosus var. bracteatus]